MRKLMWRSRINAASVLCAVLFAISISGSAQAQVSINFPGNGAFGSNILFNDPTLPSDGFHVVGVLNANPTFFVNFDSAIEQHHTNGGQARIETILPDERLNDITVSLDSGNGFTRYIFNAFRDGLKGDVPLTVTAFFTDGVGANSFRTFDINGGENFVEVLADAGFFITSVHIFTPDLPDTKDTEYGLDDLRQNRIEGAQVITPNVVPEGNSLAMLGLGGFPVLGIVLRRRKLSSKS